MEPKALFDIIDVFTKAYLQGMLGPAHILEPTRTLQKVDYTRCGACN